MGRRCLRRGACGRTGTEAEGPWACVTRVERAPGGPVRLDQAGAASAAYRAGFGRGMTVETCKSPLAIIPTSRYNKIYEQARDHRPADGDSAAKTAGRRVRLDPREGLRVDNCR